MTGRIEAWRAPEREDVAVLRLDAVLLEARPLPLGSTGGTRGHRARAYGFPAQAVAGGHFGYLTVGDLLPATAEDAPLLQLTGANDLTTGFSGGPVVDEATGLVIGMVSAIPGLDPYRRGEGIAYATPTASLREAWPELTPQEVCPYPGLEPFTAAQARWFHGYASTVDRVLDRLADGRRPILLLGPRGRQVLARAGRRAARAGRGRAAGQRPVAVAGGPAGRGPAG